MDSFPANLSFKENVLPACLVSTVFGIVTAVVSLALFFKVSDNFLLLIPGLLLLALSFLLLRFALTSFLSRQIVTITPKSLTSRSLARGNIEINWPEVSKVSEEDLNLKLGKVAGIMPNLEIIMALYLPIPVINGVAGRSLLVIESRDERKISLRSHLLYPHRLEQLRQAISRYAPRSGSAARILKLNLNN